MKTRHATFLSLAGTMLCSLTALTAMNAARAADTSLNVYNWSDYITKDTIANFEKQSGVNVKYDSYDSDDTLQAKLLAGSSGYDIVVPTSSYMARQIEAGVYQKIDKSKMPNLANLDPV
jgi:putrescine transport system substrate-binding protein